MKKIKKIFCLFIFIFIQSKIIISSLSFIETDGSLGIENALLVDFYKTKLGKPMHNDMDEENINQKVIRIESRYDLKLLDAGENTEIFFWRSIINGRLYMPLNINKVILSNTIIQGGIKFESGNGIIEKKENVLLGLVEGGKVKDS
jgi:hypothetical protein